MRLLLTISMKRDLKCTILSISLIFEAHLSACDLNKALITSGFSMEFLLHEQNSSELFSPKSVGEY